MTDYPYARRLRDLEQLESQHRENPDRHAAARYVFAGLHRLWRGTSDVELLVQIDPVFPAKLTTVSAEVAADMLANRHTQGRACHLRDPAWSLEGDAEART